MFLEIATRDSESRLFSDLISVKHGKNKKIGICLQMSGVSLGTTRPPIFI